MSKTIAIKELPEIGLQALQQAAQQAYQDHAQTHDQIVLFEEGNVVTVNPEMYIDKNEPQIMPPRVRKAS